MGGTNRIRYRRRPISLALFCLLTLAVIVPSVSAADHVRIGVARTTGASPSIIANAKGMFAAEGIDAELLFFESAQPIAVAVAAGDCDFGSTGMTAAFFNLAAQGTLRIVGAGTWENPAFQSVGMMVSNQAYAGGLHAFKDIGGHSVAITQLGSPLQYFVVEIAEHFHIPTSSIRFLPMQSNGNVGSAIAGGQADTAIQTSAPILSQVARGDAKLLGWINDVLPPHQGEVLFVSTRLANDKPEIVKRTMVGFRGGERYIHDTFVNTNGERFEGPQASDVIQTIAKVLNQPEAVIRQGIAYFDPQSRVSVADVGAIMAWYKSQNMLKSDVTAKSLIDTRYAIEMPEKK